MEDSESAFPSRERIMLEISPPGSPMIMIFGLQIRYLDIRMTVWLLFCLILPFYYTIAPMFTPGVWGLDDCGGHAVVPSCIKYTEPESVIIIHGQIKRLSCLFCFEVEWSSLALTSASNCLGLLRAGTTGVDGHIQLHSAHFLRSNTS